MSDVNELPSNSEKITWREFRVSESDSVKIHSFWYSGIFIKQVKNCCPVFNTRYLMCCFVLKKATVKLDGSATYTNLSGTLYD